jgi:hypothetical protein
VVELPPLDFNKATERVYFGGADGSRVTFRLLDEPQ